MENEQIKQTEIIVVLDRSGSMASIAKSTVEGFNTFLNEQKNAEGEAFMTLLQFDDRYEMNYQSMPIKDVAELIERETFIPRGSTALYDAIGKTINDLKTDRDVVFVIITDGQENASKEFKGEAIKKMIETLETENKWKFLYLGANQDAVMTGATLGVRAANSMSWAASADGVGNTFMAMSSNIGTYRKSKTKYAEYVAENKDSAIAYADYVAESSIQLGFDDIQRSKSMGEKDNDNNEKENK
jgi:hypothetical protein